LAGRVIDVGPKRAIAVAQEDGNGSGGPVGDGQIELAISIEIARCYGCGGSGGGVVNVRLKSAVAPAQQNGNSIVVRVDHGQVKLAVFVEITCSYRFRASAWTRGVGNAGLKRAVHLAEEDGNGVIRLVDEGQVEYAVAVEIARGHGPWTVTGGKVRSAEHIPLAEAFGSESSHPQRR